MRNEGAFHFRGTQAVTADIEHVIETAHDPEVAVFVAPGTVASKIPAFVKAPVDLLIAFLVAPKGAKHGGPWFANDETASLVGFAILPVRIDHGGIDSKERKRCGAGLGRRRA